ncbi:hypothetical protein FS837_011612 [Tulasnella sp. UAMH 9824]|nr:hypothetical protein FS837_011612 [Tulasnella sp. UAMH 9824]
MIDFTTMLPLETWLIVLEFLAVPLPRNNMAATSEGDSIILRSSSGIRAVSTVSRFFYQLADPFRFREVHFVVHPWKDSILKFYRIKELLDLLKRRPEIKSWIRILSIDREQVIPGGVQDDFEAGYIELERRIHKMIPDLRGLRELRCRCISFTSALFSAILQLPQLNDLELERFRFLPGSTDPTPDWSAVRQDEPRLRRLTVKTFGPFLNTTPAAEALVHLLRQETLAELNYWPSPLSVGWVSLVSIISSRIPDYVFEGLRKLNIVLTPTDAEVQDFVQIGARCPNIVSLTIRWKSIHSQYLIGDQLRRMSLKEHPFPALQEFDGQLALATIFVQGRPVHSVNNHGMNTRIPDERGPVVISSIAALRPSVPLRVLRLTTVMWDETYIETIVQHHTELEELVHEYWGEPLIWTAGLGDALGKLAKMQRLSLKRRRNGAPNNLIHKLDDDNPVIAKLRRSCPNLQQVNLCWLGVWKLLS